MTEFKYNKKRLDRYGQAFLCGMRLCVPVLLPNFTKLRLSDGGFSRMVQDARFFRPKAYMHTSRGGKMSKHKAVSPSMGFTALVT